MQDWWTDGQTNKLFPADFNQAKTLSYLDPPIQSTVIYTLAAQSNETKQDWADFRVLIWIGSTISFKIFKLRFYMKLYEIQLYNWYNCFYPRWVPASATWAWGCSRLELRSASISDISLSLALARKNLAYWIFSQATAAASKLLIGLTPRETLYRHV